MTFIRFPSLLAAGLLCAAMSAIAAPVSFNVTGASLTPESGYGIDSAENGGTLLDVRFSTGAFAAQLFNLSVGAQQTFQIGTVNFLEPNTGSGGNQGIRNQEIDDLGVQASITLLSPTAAAQILTATGTAVLGIIDDLAIDFTLSWTPLLNVAFGNGGLFDISLNTLTFANNNEGAKALFATIALRAEPNSVPEPGSLALILAAFAASALATRRRRG